MDTANEKGTRTEAMVMTALIHEGCIVLLPFGVARYDLAVDLGAGPLKTVQCKTGRLSKGAVVWNTKSTRTYATTAQRDYRAQVDYFGVWCAARDETFLVPVDAVGRSEGFLRVEASRNKQERGVRWARDFRLADIIARARGV